MLVDTAMELETNATKGLARENSLILERGRCSDDAVVKMAQTFRSGTNDIDAIDFVDMFLEDEEQIDLDELNELYVLVNFRPGGDQEELADGLRRGRLRQHASACRRSSPPACDSRTTSIASGSSRTASPRPTSTRRRTTSRTTTCGTRWPPRSSTRRCPTCSSGRSRPPSARLDELSIAFDYEGEVTAEDAAGDPRQDRGAVRPGAGGGRGRRRPRAGRGPAAVRRQPPKGVLRVRAGLLPAEPAADRRRRGQRDQGIDRAVADAGRDLLFPEGPPGPAADPGQQPEEIGRLNPYRTSHTQARRTNRASGALMRIAQVAPFTKAFRRNCTAGPSESSPT